jgi:hypothetical protein
MSVLIPFAFSVALAAGPSVAPILGSPKATALAAPVRSQPAAPRWGRLPSPVASGLVHARFSRRGGASRGERGATSLGTRLAFAPRLAWTVLARACARVATSGHEAVTFQRGPPSYS